MLFLVKKENCLLCKMTKVTLTKLEKGGIFPSLTVMFGKTPQQGLVYIAFPAVLFRFTIPYPTEHTFTLCRIYGII